MMTFDAGDEIMTEGEAGDCMYVLVDGEVVVTIAKAGEVARKYRGDWFGELALSEQKPSTHEPSAVKNVSTDFGRTHGESRVFAQCTMRPGQRPSRRGVGWSASASPGRRSMPMSSARWRTPTPRQPHSLSTASRG